MKRYAMEFIGTFFLTLAISLGGNPFASGLMLLAMIYCGGHISGAQFNPAVSFACFVQNKLKLADVGMYVFAQSFGACAALVVFMMITNNVFTLDMVAGADTMGPLMIEALLVMVLCWVYLTMNFSERYKNSSIQGVVIGLTLMAIASVGSLFNPAVALGSIVCNLMRDGVMVDLGSLAVYVVGPLLGAIAAAYLFDFFSERV